jgi:hypothetical protein
MKKSWIFFALVPLCSYAAIQEEWLLESYAPLELLQEKPLEKRNSEISDQTSAPVRKTKQYRSEKIGQYRKSDSALQDKNSRRVSRRAQRKHPIDERSQDAVLSSHLEPSTPKEQSKKSKNGLRIETNRKPENHAYLTQENTAADSLVEEEEERAPIENSVQKSAPASKEKNNPKQYRYKARERISAETDKYNEKMTIKRKNASAIKNSRQAEKEVN